MTKRTGLILCCGAVLAMLCASGTVTAQVLYGTLTGNVTDPSGALIPRNRRRTAGLVRG
ncbi:MAG: hypothetical protein Q8N47_25045 [Bryobacterales bacterium]|nr:hypothetical protein [Bryobacterales bacterium]